MELVTNESIMTFTLRLILGILFFMQGYDKVIRVKMPGVIESFKYEFGKVNMPQGVLAFGAYLSSFIELICGLTLILGIFTKYSLYLIGFDLVLVTAAFSLINPVWDMKIVFPRIILWCALMLTPNSYNKLSLDFFLLK
ncbi:MAG: DoxX family protein [Bacteroidetes bacterium]|nr:DoxX family protein [Bacteroidota bacterium]